MSAWLTIRRQAADEDGGVEPDEPPVPPLVPDFLLPPSLAELTLPPDLLPSEAPEALA